MLAETEGLVRIFASVIIGILIGYFRRRKAAGLRTFTLICLGCTAFTLLSFNDFFAGSNTDSARIVGHIIAGIGFLGMGVIWHSFKQKGRPVGLTTAATVWVTAAIGILIGLGSWVEATTVAALTMAIVYYREPKTLKKEN
ncbi:MgtC/SapB family protein [Candidatus Micrarchaeota archaeon]|nr:MgtC/SapB family protein [Candidatus Micrarchaeota archaeon]